MDNQLNNQVIQALERHRTTVKEAIQCPVCLDIMDRPVRVPDCTHAFCTSCLLSTQNAGWRGCEICIDGHERIRDEFICHHHFRCPVCRTILSYSENEIKQLPPTMFLNEIIAIWNKYVQFKGNGVNVNRNRLMKFYKDSVEILLHLMNNNPFIRLTRKDHQLSTKHEDIAQNLEFILKHGSQYEPTELEAIFFKAIRKIIELEELITKKLWLNNSRNLRRNAKRHQSRPSRRNITLDNESLGLNSIAQGPFGPVERLLEVLSGYGNARNNSGLREILLVESPSILLSPFQFDLFDQPQREAQLVNSSLSEMMDTFIALVRSLSDQ